jgi:DNA replicative helicase MCM subunit Mcm2 (Cdc46/Mcm family)
LIADRYNVGKCVPGDRVRITGIMIINDSKYEHSICRGSMYVTGIEKLRERTTFQYTQSEEEIFKKMAKD